MFGSQVLIDMLQEKYPPDEDTVHNNPDIIPWKEKVATGSISLPLR